MEKAKKKQERMSFVDFNTLFLDRSRMDNVDASVYAPIVYGMKNKYFDAAVKYLKNGEQKIVSYKNYSTDLILKSYISSSPNYIQALVILNNIEQTKVNGPVIFNPDIVE